MLEHTTRSTRVSLLITALTTVGIAISVASSTALSFPARFGLSPDNNLSLLLDVVNSAKKTLVINIYQMEHPAILDAIIDRIENGVATRILVEGEPVEQLSPEARKTLNALRSAMDSIKGRRNHLFLMRKPVNQDQDQNEKRRFRFNHAKYIIVDAKRVLISSENFKTSGHPVAGNVGNRGWDVSFSQSTLARQLGAVFKDDSSLAYGDVEELTAGKKARQKGGVVQPTQDFFPASDSASKRQAPLIPEGAGEVADAALINSPNSLEGLQEVIRGARETLEIEQMSLPQSWRTQGEYNESPLVTEILQAARRGTQVRVLLNDDNAFLPGPKATVSSDEPRGNEKTILYLRDVAKAERLPLEARTVSIRRVEINYIHNKGIIADRARVLVSSINGTQNSVLNNREVAVLLESPDAGDYYGRAFDFDWTRSAPRLSQEENTFVTTFFPGWLQQGLSEAVF